MRRCKKTILLLICFIGTLSIAHAQDVIIKKDGLIIHADLIEVGLEILKYRKSSYPNGPVFSLPINEVYAIAYGDKTSDYFVLPSTGDIFSNNDYQEEQIADTLESEPMEEQVVFSNSNIMESIRASIGIGIFNTYSKAEEGIENISKQTFLPAFNFRVWMDLEDNIKIGLQLTATEFNFSMDEFNNYDDVVILTDIDENIFSLVGFGRYDFRGDIIKPYALAGIGFNQSRIHTQRNLSFVEEGPLFNINSYAQTINLAIMLRAGVSVVALDNISFYIDAGTGISVLQTGIQFEFN